MISDAIIQKAIDTVKNDPCAHVFVTTASIKEDLYFYDRDSIKLSDGVLEFHTVDKDREIYIAQDKITTIGIVYR